MHRELLLYKNNVISYVQYRRHEGKTSHQIMHYRHSFNRQSMRLGNKFNILYFQAVMDYMVFASPAFNATLTKL